MLLHTFYTLIEMINYLLFFYIFFGASPTRSTSKYIIFLCNIFAFNILPLNVELDTYVFPVLGFILSIFVLNGDKKENIINFISVFTLNHIFSLLFLYILAIFLNLSFEATAYSLAYCLFANVAVTLCLLITILAKKHMHLHNEPLIIFYSRSYYILLAFSLFIISGIIGTIQALSIFSNIDSFLLNMVSLFFIVLIIVFFIMWIALSNTYRKKLFHQHQEDLARLRISDQEKRFTMIRDSDTALKKFRHDIINHMTILNNLINYQKYSEAAHYLNSIAAAFEKTNCFTFTNIAAVDAVISHYYQQINYKKVKFKWNNSCISMPDNIDSFDLCTIFDNLLSNALRACDNVKDSGEPQPEISVSLSVKNGHLIVRQTNTSYTYVNFGDDGLPITTKKDKTIHGIGSKNIKSITEKYNGVIKYYKCNGLFCVDIII